MHIVLGPTPSKTGATPRKQASRHTAREKHLVEQNFIKTHNVIDHCYLILCYSVFNGQLNIILKLGTAFKILFQQGRVLSVSDS